MGGYLHLMRQHARILVGKCSKLSLSCSFRVSFTQPFDLVESLDRVDLVPTQVWQLILLQGVLCGISGAVLYTPVLIWLQEWWVIRRGMASGLM